MQSCDWLLTDWAKLIILRASLLNLHKQSFKLLNDLIYFSSLLSTARIHCFVFLELLSAPSYRHLLIWILLWLEIWTMQAAYTQLQNYLCVWEHRGGGRLPRRYKNSQIVKERVYCCQLFGWMVVFGEAFSSLLDPHLYLQNVQSQVNTKNTHAWKLANANEAKMRQKKVLFFLSRLQNWTIVHTLKYYKY